MKKIGLALSLMAALALPGTALAHKPEGKGKRHRAAGCAAHVSSKGKRARCELKRQALRAAVGQCRDERAQDVVAFEQKYGAEHGMRNCIRRTVQQTIGQFKNAAHECKAEAADDPAAFQDRYGTKPNAFGKCVSSHVREGDQGGRGDDTGDGNGGDDGDSEGDDDQPGQDDAPGQEDDGQEDPGQPDLGGGDV
jgi:hypothetical protein